MSHYDEIVSFGWEVKDNGCWYLKKRPNSGRYYRICFKNIKKQAHRVMLEHRIGRDLLPYPKELACHTCDDDLCINPDHLYVGDYHKNNQETQKRYGIEITVCKNGHDLTLKGSVAVDKASGDGRCVICHREKVTELLQK